MVQKRRAVFFDRDGVINDTIDRGDQYAVLGKKVRFTAPFSYEEFHMKDGVAEAILSVRHAGFLCILVTNQPDVAYKLLPMVEYERIMAVVATLPWDDVFVCMHGRYDACECKKPKPGMILAAAEKHGIDLPSSCMVGDTKSDMEAGIAAGTKTVLIDCQYNRDVVSDHRIAHIRELSELFIQHVSFFI